jgi:hypothetical protein
MAQNKVINIEPVYLTATLTTNLLNFAITSLSGPVGFTMTQPYVVIKHVRIINRTGTAATFSLWKGGTGGNVAGTEVIGTATSVAANSSYDWYGIMRFDSTDFLVGGSGTASALVLTAEGEIGIA